MVDLFFLPNFASQGGVRDLGVGADGGADITEAGWATYGSAPQIEINSRPIQMTLVMFDGTCRNTTTLYNVHVETMISPAVFGKS